jgi:HPt (histidine-containing phosphotransfer) domain-containing protein
MATDLYPSTENLCDAADAARNDGERPLEFDELVRRCMGRIELVERLLASFEDRFPKELSQIEECLIAGDVERLTRLTHQLKGTAANVSAPVILAIATKMEESARARRLETVTTHLSDVRDAWEQFRAYKATLPRSPGPRADQRRTSN